MNLLLDTHTMLWFFWDDPQLSATAKALIEDPSNRKVVSIATCWEVVIKVSVGKLNLGESAGGFLNREITQNNFEFLAIGLNHLIRVELLTMHHRDPFDRLLIAQSIVEGFPIISCDAQLDAYGVTRLW